MLLEVCGRSPLVTVCWVEDGDFKDYESYFQLFYERYNPILKWHIFSCQFPAGRKARLCGSMRESNLPEHRHNKNVYVVKTNFLDYHQNSILVSVTWHSWLLIVLWTILFLAESRSSPSSQLTSSSSSAVWRLEKWYITPIPSSNRHCRLLLLPCHDEVQLLLIQTPHHNCPATSNSSFNILPFYLFAPCSQQFLFVGILLKKELSHSTKGSIGPVHVIYWPSVISISVTLAASIYGFIVFVIIIAVFLLSREFCHQRNVLVQLGILEEVPQLKSR